MYYARFSGIEYAEASAEEGHERHGHGRDAVLGVHRRGRVRFLDSEDFACVMALSGVLSSQMEIDTCIEQFNVGPVGSRKIAKAMVAVHGHGVDECTSEEVERR